MKAQIIRTRTETRGFAYYFLVVMAIIYGLWTIGLILFGSLLGYWWVPILFAGLVFSVWHEGQKDLKTYKTYQEVEIEFKEDFYGKKRRKTKGIGK